MQLYLQNYSGSITIGFDGIASMKIADYFENDPIANPDGDNLIYKNRKKFDLSINLKGLHKNNFMNKVSLPQYISLKDGDIMETNVRFNPVDPGLSRIFDTVENMKESCFVDELFMERVGSDIVIHDNGIKNLMAVGKKEKAVSLTNNQRNVSLSIPANCKINVQEDIPKGIRFACKPVNSIFHIP